MTETVAGCRLLPLGVYGTVEPQRQNRYIYITKKFNISPALILNMWNCLCAYWKVSSPLNAMKSHWYLLHQRLMCSCMLHGKGDYSSQTYYSSVSLCVFTCHGFRFKAGPEWRTSGAGPHIQPGDGLWLAQCQRDPCHRRPGHMKTNTLTLLYSSPPPSQSPSTSFAFLPLLHRKDAEEQRGK